MYTPNFYIGSLLSKSYSQLLNHTNKVHTKISEFLHAYN